MTTFNDEWRFVQGPGVDDPLVGLMRPATGGSRLLYFITDGAGRQLMVTDSSGKLDATDLPGPGNPRGHWRYAGATASANTFTSDRQNPINLPTVALFRNRLYDQKSGRWTQEDPVGIAGGINQYRYNENNPVLFSDPFGLQGCRDPKDLICKMAVDITNRTKGLEGAVVVGLGVQLAPLAIVAGAEGLAAGGVAKLGLAARATPVAAAASRVPFPEFQKWGREVVGWGQNAAGAVRATLEMTGAKAATIDPAKVQAAKTFYEGAVASGKGGAAAQARVKLMERILELQRQ